MRYPRTPLLTALAFAVLCCVQAQTSRRIFGGSGTDAALATARTTDGGWSWTGFTCSFVADREDA